MPMNINQQIITLKILTLFSVFSSIFKLKIWVFEEGFLKFLNLLFRKINFFPIKNHLVFLTIERYDIELTNIKISDKNIVPPAVVPRPLKGNHFYCYFKIVLVLVWNAKSAKIFKLNFLLFVVESIIL